ncbi:MAG: phosphatase PAP2 family protein [Steroidobacteraceae bacterium]
MSAVNPVDAGIVLWLNHFAGRWGSADAFINVVSNNNLVQAVVPVTLLWYLWFRKGSADAVRRTRELVIATLLGSCVAVLLARGLALLLPFRTRPFATPGLAYHLIHSQWDQGLHAWSSFPSDHAALFFALATGILLISRSAGIAMLIYATLVDCLPRVYLGIHYPSDIAAGALLGILLARLAAMQRIRRPVAARVLHWMDASPGVAHAALFLCAFEIASMFDSAIQMAQISADLALSVVRFEHLRAVPALAGCLALLVGMVLLIGIALRARRIRPDASAHWWRPALLELTHDAIIIWEMDGAGILYWNAAAERLYGYSRDEAHGQVTHSLLHTRLPAGRGVTELEGTLARLGIWVGELIHTTRAGRQVRVEGQLALLSQQNGRWLVLEVNRSTADCRESAGARRSAESQLATLRRAMVD